MTLTWFIVLMFWTVSDEPYFEPGFYPVQVERVDCQRAANVMLPVAREIVRDTHGRFAIACLGATDMIDMQDLIIKAFNIKKGRPA